MFRILTQIDNELLMSLHNVNIQMLIERIMQESHVGCYKNVQIFKIMPLKCHLV